MDNNTVICRIIDNAYIGDNHFTIVKCSAKIKDLDDEAKALIKPFINENSKVVHFSATGTALPTIKAFYEFTGSDFYNHERYGLQMKVTSFKLIPPNDKEGMIKYLQQFIKGCGPKTAAKIVNAFGSDTLEVLENTPDRLKEVKGIRAKTIEKIKFELKKKNLNKYKELSELLQPYGVSSDRIIKIHDFFSIQKDKRKKTPNVAELIKDNPFKLTYFKGFGFDILDKMGADFGLDPTDSLRIEAAIISVLRKNNANGHLYLRYSSPRTEKGEYVIWYGAESS